MPALRRPLFAFTALAVAFVALSAVVALGLMRAADRDVSAVMTGAWREPLHVAFQAIALLGGLEATTLVVGGLALWLWRKGLGADVLAIAAFPVALVVETLYKKIVDHPAPPLAVGHADGPSLSTLFERGAAIAGSYPSGHVVRAVIAYGLVAFVVVRMSASAAVRRLAVAVAVLVVALLCFDRLYLNVHWESDVIGGLLLGGVGLAAAIIWLDRPVRTAP